MSFITHLQSSLILGTKMTHPDEEHFHNQKCTKIFSIIQDNNIEDLKELLEFGIDSDKCELEHLSPLSFAIKHKNYFATKTLLSFGCNVNFLDIFSKYPLDYSTDEKTTDLLLSFGAINSKFPKSKIPFYDNLTEAVNNSDLKSITHLYNTGHNLHVVNENLTSLLHLSVEVGNSKILIYLLNKGINIDIIDKSKTSPLMLSTIHPQNINILKILVKRNATLDQKNMRQVSALSMAIKRKNIIAATYLIKNGADVNIRDNKDTPLSLTHKAIEDTDDIGLKNELRELETLLLTKYAHVNNSDDKLLWSPIMQTASHYQDKNNIEHLKSLIKLGANIDQIDKNHRTALMIASSLGRVEAMEILLRYCADLNKVDKFGWTSLMLSVYYNQKEAVKLLLFNGVDVNFKSSKGLSALKVAIDNDRVSIINLLKEFGAVSPSD